MWFGPDQNVTALANFMKGYEVGSGALHCYIHSISRHLRLGAGIAGPDDVSYEDAVDYALKLVRRFKEHPPTVVAENSRCSHPHRKKHSGGEHEWYTDFNSDVQKMGHSTVVCRACGGYSFIKL